MVRSPRYCSTPLWSYSPGSQEEGGWPSTYCSGEALRRLVSKCLSREALADTLKILPPLQVGVGVKSGCEAIVHAVSQILEDSSLSPDSRWCLLLDFSNAFNCIDRSCMFNEIRSQIPGLAA